MRESQPCQPFGWERLLSPSPCSVPAVGPRPGARPWPRASASSPRAQLPLFVPDLLADMAAGAAPGPQGRRPVEDRRLARPPALDVPEEKNQAKKALAQGKVDVLTLSADFSAG